MGLAVGAGGAVLSSSAGACIAALAGIFAHWLPRGLGLRGAGQRPVEPTAVEAQPLAKLVTALGEFAPKSPSDANFLRLRNTFTVFVQLMHLANRLEQAVSLPPRNAARPQTGVMPQARLNGLKGAGVALSAVGRLPAVAGLESGVAWAGFSTHCALRTASTRVLSAAWKRHSAAWLSAKPVWGLAWP